MTYVTNMQRPGEPSGAASRAVQPGSRTLGTKRQPHTFQVPTNKHCLDPRLDPRTSRARKARSAFTGVELALCADVLTKAISRKAQEIGMGIGCVHLTLFLCL